MSDSRCGNSSDHTVIVLLVALFVVLFGTTASTHRRRAAMEERLLDRLDQVDRQLLHTIHRREHAGVDQ